jgi:hypothetical protein
MSNFLPASQNWIISASSKLAMKSTGILDLTSCYPTLSLKAIFLSGYAKCNINNADWMLSMT